MLADADVEVAVIWGGERSGKTSLLRMLTLLADDRDFLPVHVEGLRFTQKHQADLSSLVKRSVEEQYGPGAFDAFCQSTSPRYLLLDDVEFTPDKIELMRAGINSITPLYGITSLRSTS